MRTVKIEWTEVSSHMVYLQVPDEADLDNYFLANAVAELDNDGFTGCEREDFTITESEDFDKYDQLYLDAAKINGLESWDEDFLSCYSWD